MNLENSLMKMKMAGLLEIQTLQDRLDRLQELTEFTENCKKQLQDIFETLGWSQDYRGSVQEALVQCPYDPDHRVPVSSLERHKASCSLRQTGYTAEEQAEMYDPSVCYENNSIRSFTMDKSTQHQVILQARSAAPLMRMEGVFWQVTVVLERHWALKSYAALVQACLSQYSGQPVDVPQNHKRAVCDLTVADRLALYDHVVGVVTHQREQATSSSNEDLYVDLVKKLQKYEEQNEPKTHLELIAEMRDYKRRRQSYRAKNVHITKKSYTEVIREVITIHSEELARQWREDGEQETMSELSDRHHLDERRSASSESHQSDSRHRRRRDRSQDRDGKKKKKKRERDSCSPDDQRHHERKKKKKKKKDDRDKEK